MIYHSVACGRGAVAMATQSPDQSGRGGSGGVVGGVHADPNALPGARTCTAVQPVIKIMRERERETLRWDLLIRLWRAELEISGAEPH